MLNIIIAQLFQTKKDKMIYGSVGLVIMLILILLFQEFEESSREVTGSELVMKIGGLITGVSLIFLLISVADIIGNDFIDKTINYEVLSGHLRSQVYFGRAIVALVYGVIGTMIFATAVPIVISLVNGWGGHMELEEVIVRYLLLACVFFRLTCLIILFTVIVKNTYITYIGIYLTAAIEAILYIFFLSKHSWILSIGNLVELMDFMGWSKSLLDGTPTMISDSALSGGLIIETVISSCAVGIIALILGYVFFQQDDLS